MTVTTLTSAEASSLSVKTLGLDPESVALDSAEALAASLLRAASFLCPTSPVTLVNAVLAVVRPLSLSEEVDRDRLVDLLDMLISSGDLLELRQDLEGRSARLIYLGPPTFIERAPGDYRLLGVRPYGAKLMEDGQLPPIDVEGHVRAIQLDPHAGVEALRAAGLRQIERQQWVASPSAESSGELIRRTGQRLDSAGGGGEIEGLQILDHAKPVHYYRGRWREPVPGDNGDFIGRRPQAYGADLWSAVRIRDGAAARIFQFPVDDPVVPARDEAWRVQFAIDAARGEPQRFTTEPSPRSASTVFKFFSPVPGFAERYLQLVGTPLPGSSGALFAFRVSDGATSDLIQLLTDLLWMEPILKKAK